MTKQDRLNVYLDPQVCMNIKIYAVKTKQSVSKAVEQAIIEFLEKQQNEQ